MDQKSRNINNATIIVICLCILGFAWFYMPDQLSWAVLWCVVLLFIDIWYNSTH